MGGTRTADPRVKRRESDPLHHDASNKNNDNASENEKHTQSTYPRRLLYKLENPSSIAYRRGVASAR